MNKPLAAVFTPRMKGKTLDMKIQTSRKAGFTLVEIMIVVAIIGLLAAIAIPNFIKARTTSQKNACINNLRQIDGAIQQYALESNTAASGAVVSANIVGYLGRGAGSLPVCPSGGTSFSDSYTISTVSTPPTCQKVPSGDNAHVLPTS